MWREVGCLRRAAAGCSIATLCAHLERLKAVILKVVVLCRRRQRDQRGNAGGQREQRRGRAAGAALAGVPPGAHPRPRRPPGQPAQQGLATASVRAEACTHHALAAGASIMGALKPGQACGMRREHCSRQQQH